MNLTLLDLRRAVSGLVLVLVLAAFIPVTLLCGACSLLGRILTVTADGLAATAEELARWREDVLHWANPDIYGGAPQRCRKLVYSRRTVEELRARVEVLSREAAGAQKNGAHARKIRG